MAKKIAGSQIAETPDNKSAGQIKQIKWIKQIERIIQIGEPISRGGK